MTAAVVRRGGEVGPCFRARSRARAHSGVIGARGVLPLLLSGAPPSAATGRWAHDYAWRDDVGVVGCEARTVMNGRARAARSLAVVMGSGAAARDGSLPSKSDAGQSRACTGDGDDDDDDEVEDRRVCASAATCLASDDGLLLFRPLPVGAASPRSTGQKALRRGGASSVALSCTRPLASPARSQPRTAP